MIALSLAHQLSISEALTAFANTLCSGTIQSETEFSRKDYIYFALVDKNLVTFDAIRCLAKLGYADDAFVLVRTLAECTVNATYVVSKTDVIANDYADFTKFMAWKEFEGMKAVAPESIKNISDEEIKKMETEFESVKDRYKNIRPMDWCSTPLFQRAKEIDNAISSDFNLYRGIINSAWRKSSAYVHGTAASISSRLSESEKGIVIHRQFREEESAAALYAANFVMFALLAFTDLRLGKKYAEDWRALHARWAGDASPAA